MSAMAGRVAQRIRHRPLRWILYLLIALGALVLEMGGELFGGESGSNAGSPAILSSLLYQKFATAAYRKPHRNFVRLVTLSPSSEPQEIFVDVCKKREFEAAVIRQLMTLPPTEVVMDFWYGPKSCLDGDDQVRAKKLEDAIGDPSRHFPIVIGLASHTTHEFELAQDPDLFKLAQAGFSRRDQVLNERLEFPGKEIGAGLVRINADTRRIPIRWNVYTSKAAVISHATREQRPSLSYQAASRRDPKLGEILKDINDHDEHPFTNFIPETEFEPVHAIDLVCGRALNDEEDWRNCNPPDVADDARFSRLKQGQIILVAENSEKDHFQTVLGEVPGYVLQANYIESLADNRVFRPTPPWLEITLSVCGLLVIILCFEMVSNSLLGLVSAYGAVALIAVICNVAGIYFGSFVGFWLSLVPMPFLEWVFTLKMRSAPEKGEEEKALERGAP